MSAVVNVKSEVDDGYRSKCGAGVRVVLGTVDERACVHSDLKVDEDACRLWSAGQTVVGVEKGM